MNVRLKACPHVCSAQLTNIHQLENIVNVCHILKQLKHQRGLRWCHFWLFSHDNSTAYGCWCKEGSYLDTTVNICTPCQLNLYKVLYITWYAWFIIPKWLTFPIKLTKVYNSFRTQKAMEHVHRVRLAKPLPHLGQQNAHVKPNTIALCEILSCIFRVYTIRWFTMYRSDPSLPCLECVNGAVCSGGEERPQPAYGFWPVNIMADPPQFHSCFLRDSCPGGNSSIACAVGWTLLEAWLSHCRRDIPDPFAPFAKKGIIGLEKLVKSVNSHSHS